MAKKCIAKIKMLETFSTLAQLDKKSDFPKQNKSLFIIGIHILLLITLYAPPLCNIKLLHAIKNIKQMTCSV